MIVAILLVKGVLKKNSFLVEKWTAISIFLREQSINLGQKLSF
jgi:hypothetical protein